MTVSTTCRPHPALALSASLPEPWQRLLLCHQRLSEKDLDKREQGPLHSRSVGFTLDLRGGLRGWRRVSGSHMSRGQGGPSCLENPTSPSSPPGRSSFEAWLIPEPPRNPK